VLERRHEVAAIVGDDDSGVRGSGEFGDVRIVNPTTGGAIRRSGLQHRETFARWEIVYRDAREDFIL
jgi:hypothetical protein